MADKKELEVTKNSKNKVAEETIVEESNSYKTIGDELQEARLAKKITLETVSQSLNIKVVQLEAIEKGDLTKLPEMIYAVGFVRNYANYLGMDSKYASERFKDEHLIQSRKAQDLSFMEPLYENSVPGPTILGVGSFLSIGLLVIWIIYSSVDMGKIKSSVDTSSHSTSKIVYSLDGSVVEYNTKIREPEFVAIEDDVVEVISVDTDELSDEMVEKVATRKPEVQVIDDAKSGEAKLAPVAIQEVEVKVVETNAPKMEGEAITTPAVDRVQIQSKAPEVLLKAIEASWIQVTDSNQKVIFRKVLRPGDEYVAPNQKGLTLVTANAGGLEVYVRGDKVQPIGNSGEIVRGVSLNPSDLSQSRIRARR